MEVFSKILALAHVTGYLIFRPVGEGANELEPELSFQIARAWFRTMESPHRLRTPTTQSVTRRWESSTVHPRHAPPPPTHLRLLAAAGSVRRVGRRSVEHPVPVQGPQADVGEEEESRNEQPRELQQPLLLPPHRSGRRITSRRNAAAAAVRK